MKVCARADEMIVVNQRFAPLVPTECHSSRRMSSDQKGPLGEAALLKTAGSVPGLVLKAFGVRKEPDLAVEDDVGDYSTETYRDAITAAVASATLLFFTLLTPREGTPNFHAPYPAPLCSGHR